MNLYNLENFKKLFDVVPDFDLKSTSTIVKLELANYLIEKSLSFV